MSASPIDDAILTLQKGLAGIPFEFAYLGGSVLSLLVTDPTVDTIRVTKDVDVMMGIRTRKEFHAADKLLEKAGFRHDTREGAPICRWTYRGVTVDVLPIREDVLGWKSKWFEEALKAAEEKELGGQKIRIVSPPYFVALKLEAFEERGQGDFLASTDFEDVICLFNGRATLASEIAACESLRSGLAEKFRGYLQSEAMLDAVEGFVQTEPDPAARKGKILAAFKAVSDL